VREVRRAGAPRAPWPIAAAGGQSGDKAL